MSCSRPNMAKDVIKKKQRIAHNKANEGHEIFPEYDDFLTSIIQDMDNNDLMAAMCFSNIQNNSSETSKSTFQEKTQSNVNQIPNRNHATLPKLKKYGLSRKGPLMAKSQRTLQQLQHNRKLPKPRAHLAGLSNSKSDKPSERSKTKGVYNARSINKSQNKATTEKQVHNRIVVDGNKIKRHSIEESKSKEITFKRLKPSIVEKKCPVKESSHIVDNVSEKQESVTVKKQSSEKSYISSCDQIVDNSSDSDEYEKFIQKEKKDLPKKSKKVSKNIKSQKSEKKVTRKRASKSVSTESESDLSDEESSNSYKSKKMRKTHNMQDNKQSTSSIEDKIPQKIIKKCNSRTILKSVSPSSDSEVSDDGPSTSYKKKKKVHKKLNHKLSDTSKEDSESQMDVYDEAYHNSSSESDDLPPPSEIIHGLPSTNNQFSRQMGNQHETELNFHSDKAYNMPLVASREHNLCNDTTSHEIPNSASLANSNQPNILQNKTSSCEIPNIASLVSINHPNILQNKTSSCEIPNIASMVSSDQPNVLHKSSSIHSLMGSVQPNVSCKTPDLPPLGSVRTNIECVALQNNSVSINSRQENSPKSLIVDLEESDNECESSFTIIPKIVMTSSQNASQSYSEESDIELVDVIVPPEYSDNTVEHKKAACTKNSSELNIKTEKVYETVHSIAKSQNTKSNPELQTSLISKKCEVAYTTGICQKPDKENESKANVRKQLNLNNDKLHNDKIKLSENNTVKQLNLNNELQSSIVGNAKGSLVSKKVKEEPCDDLEIILDTASTNSSINLSNKQINKNTSIKVEKDSEAVKQATVIPNINEGPIGTRESGGVENAKDLLIFNKVKKEPSDGDCEIILETTSTNNFSSNLSNVQIHSNRHIKVERGCTAVKEATSIHIANDDPIGTREVNKLIEKEQKLHEIQCSTLRSLTSSHNNVVQPLENQTINELNPFNIKALLENLKKEFATYQEILVTEQSVETTFKLLEKCQAERLKSLKTKIVQCLESAPNNSDCNSIKIAVNKLLDSPELSRSTCLKTSTKVSVCPSESSSTSDISVQDIKTLTTMNLVPLSSISEIDIKPNLSDLQCAVKQERSPSYEINSMSFGEKCIVCAKDASAACQQCAKVFFCSNECGRKYWEDGHKNACIK